MRWNLSQLKRFGLTVTQAVDVGAYRGEWAKLFASEFPNADILCVEPQSSCQPFLGELQKRNGRVRVLQALVGARDQVNVPFHETGTGSSVLESTDASGTKPMYRLDTLIGNGTCRPPEFLKLDVQGLELAVLDGWQTTFDKCHVVQMEVSLLPLIAGGPLAKDVIARMDQLGFDLYEINEFIRSPSDGGLWQLDVLFVRRGLDITEQRTWNPGDRTARQRRSKSF